MTKQTIITQKRINNKLQRPVIMFDALALVFILNALWSLVNCLYSNPMTPAYFKYINFTNHLLINLFSVRVNILYLVAIVLIIVAVILHIMHLGNNYLDYVSLLTTSLALVFAISPHWTGKTALTYYNFLIALSFFIIALAYTFAHKAVLTDKTYVILGVIIFVISVITGLLPFMRLSFKQIGIGTVLTWIMLILSCLMQTPILHYLNEKTSETKGWVSLNLAAILHLPQFAINAFTNTN